MDDERGYFVLWHVHMNFRKDNEEILRNTVQSKLREELDWMNNDLEQIEEGEIIEREFLSIANAMLRDSL